MVKKLGLCALTTLLFAYCISKPVSFYKNEVSNTTILDIAAQYGFTKNSVTAKQQETYPILYFLDSAYVRCCSEASLHEEFKNIKEILEKDNMIRREDSVFNVKKYNIKSMKDYYDLINTLPFRKVAAIEAAGGEAEYNLLVERESKKSMHIYIAKDGVITFIPPEMDKNYDSADGRYPGKRLDTLKD